MVLSTAQKNKEGRTNCSQSVDMTFSCQGLFWKSSALFWILVISRARSLKRSSSGDSDLQHCSLSRVNLRAKHF